jgi:hypothetical protein
MAGCLGGTLTKQNYVVIIIIIIIINIKARIIGS